MRKLLIAVVFLGALVAVLSWMTWASYERFVATPLTIGGDGAILEVDPGMSGRAVIERLGEMDVTEPGWRWRLLLRRQPVVIQTGEYRLEPGMTPLDLLDKLARGEVIQYGFTIVEGWTLRQLMAALAADPRLGPTMPAPGDTLPLDTTPPDTTPPNTTPLDGIAPEHDNKEGWFLPETYSYTRADDYRDVLQRAHDAMRHTLDQAWEARVAEHPVETPYELLILASIIEKETALEEERADVAGVFVRRLRKGMRLQTDPTVIYGIGDAFDGDIRRRDLETDTPYNTYTRHGLPPTPIALPGRASLFAAAQPAPGDALYFVADGAGGHTFSATLEEHQQAVERMLERRR